mmetsp:Transcript_62995/g.100058  ORF Transcript_62995/g.100058 Transcript_62995/m.100058 type:complete len:295 (-) Transcript_62995:88-972(-)
MNGSWTPIPRPLSSPPQSLCLWLPATSSISHSHCYCSRCVAVVALAVFPADSRSVPPNPEWFARAFQWFAKIAIIAHLLSPTVPRGVLDYAANARSLAATLRFVCCSRTSPKQPCSRFPWWFSRVLRTKCDNLRSLPRTFSSSLRFPPRSYSEWTKSACFRLRHKTKLSPMSKSSRLSSWTLIDIEQAKRQMLQMPTSRCLLFALFPLALDLDLDLASLPLVALRLVVFLLVAVAVVLVTVALFAWLQAARRQQMTSSLIFALSTIQWSICDLLSRRAKSPIYFASLWLLIHIW